MLLSLQHMHNFTAQQAVVRDGAQHSQSGHSPQFVPPICSGSVNKLWQAQVVTGAPFGLLPLCLVPSAPLCPCKCHAGDSREAESLSSYFEIFLPFKYSSGLQVIKYIFSATHGCLSHSFETSLFSWDDFRGGVPLFIWLQ